MNAKRPASRPRRLTVLRERGDCVRRARRGTSGNRSFARPERRATGPPGTQQAPGCISSPARYCTFHARAQTPLLTQQGGVVLADRDQAPNPRFPSTAAQLHHKPARPKDRPQARGSLRTGLRGGCSQEGPRGPHWSAAHVQTPPQRSPVSNWGLSFPICQRGIRRVLAPQS